MNTDVDFLNSLAVSEYCALYDPESLTVHSIRPLHSINSSQDWIAVEQEIAEDIMSGRVSVFDLAVTSDLLSVYVVSKSYYTSNQIQIAACKGSADLEIKFSRKTATFSLPTTKSIRLNNTGAELVFFITKKNDPHYVYQIIPISVSDIAVSKKIKIAVAFDKNKHSLFVRKNPLSIKVIS